MNKPKFPATIKRRGERFSQFRVKHLKYWEAHGCSHWGRETRRNGKRVVCGHKHKTREAAHKCAERMQREKPGQCQCYKAHFMQVYLVGYKLAAASPTTEKSENE